MKLSIVLIGVFCLSNIYAVNVQFEVQVAVAPGSLKVSKPKRLMKHVSGHGPRVYADRKGNAILFSNIYQTHQVLVDPSTKSSSIKKSSPRLAYLIYSAKKKQWLKHKFVPMPDASNRKVRNYELLNAHANTTPVLFYTMAQKSDTQDYLGSYVKGDQIWAIRKKGLTGSWTKPQKLITINDNTSPLASVDKECNSHSCVVAWKAAKTNVNNKGIQQADIKLKFLNLDVKNKIAWTKIVPAGIPDTHQLIQFKVGLLDSGNAVLVWLAASQGSQPGTATLALYARFRINGKWQAISTVAIVGGQGDVTGLGEFELASNRSRQLMVVWSEKLIYSQIGSIYFDKKWHRKSIIYNDNPQVLNLSPMISASGTAMLVWQQKYGKNSHVFNSQYSSKTNKWTVPAKLDVNAQGGVLKSMSVNNNNEMVAIWMKGFQKMQMALFDKNHKKIAQLENVAQNLHSPRLPTVALSGAGGVFTVWLNYTRTGYEIWGNIISKSKRKGVKQ